MFFITSAGMPTVTCPGLVFAVIIGCTVVTGVEIGVFIWLIDCSFKIQFNLYDY